MLVVRIEKWPFGQKEQSKEIGRAYIENDGTGTREEGNYNICICHREKFSERPPEGEDYFREARINNHSRKADVWELIHKALKACFPEEE